jgi:hypothetical protein
MAYRTRLKYTKQQKEEMWDRWQRGESLTSIGRAFDRPSSSIFGQLSPSGGIRPPPRKRSNLALSLVEREEISRGVVNQLSLRTIAAQLERLAVKSNVTETPLIIEPRKQIKRPGIALTDQNLVNWLGIDC